MSQPSLQNWLNRTPAGRKPRKRIPAESKKRAGENRQYSKARKVYLEANPYCEAIWDGCTIKATDVHHSRGRIGGLLLDEEHWIPLCRNCHRYCHDHPKEARTQGFIA